MKSLFIQRRPALIGLTNLVKNSITSITVLLYLFLVISSCKEDDEKIIASITGKWAGQTADFKVNPKGIIPAFTLGDNELPVVLDFRNDGTVTLTDKNNTTYPGTYELTDRKLNLAIGYKFEYIDLTGQYDIDELTEQNLTASTQRSGTFDFPNYGQLDGSIKATLHFTKVPN